MSPPNDNKDGSSSKAITRMGVHFRFTAAISCMKTAYVCTYYTNIALRNDEPEELIWEEITMIHSAGAMVDNTIGVGQ